MEDQDWKIIKTLYLEQNITKTAEALYKSQPALTKRLQHIEKEFGVQIVHRGRKGVHFTPHGEFLAKSADEILGRMQEIKDQLANIDDNVIGTLRLGMTNYITRNKLPKIMKQFKSQYPDVEFKVISGWSSDVYQSLHNQEVHVAFIRGDYRWEDQKQLLLNETLVVVSLTEISLRDLPYLPRIDYKCDIKLKMLIDNWWKENYYTPPKIGIAVDKAETCKEMVLNGLGYAIMPSFVISDLKEIYKIDLLDASGAKINRQTWMLYHEEFTELKIVRKFVDFMKHFDFEN